MGDKTWGKGTKKMKKYVKSNWTKFQERITQEYGMEEKRNIGCLVASGIFLLIAVLFLIVYQANLKNNNPLDILFFNMYLLLEFGAGGILFFVTYFFRKKKHADRYKKVKYFFMYVAIFLFLLVASPFIILYFVLMNIGAYFGIESVCENFLAVLMDIAVYCSVILACFYDVERIASYSFIRYLVFLLVMWGLIFGLSMLIDKIYVFGDYEKRYSYKNEIKYLKVYLVNAITVFAGIAGLYISKHGEEVELLIYTIMPLIFFMGAEQMRLVQSKRKAEQTRFLRNLYEENIILRDIALPAIKSYTNMKIRIKFSIEPYTIECQQGYLLPLIRRDFWDIILFWSKKRKKNREVVHEAFEMIRRMLLKEYKVYDEQERIIFFSDIETCIEKLAECLYRI